MVEPSIKKMFEQYGAPVWMYATKSAQATSESGSSIDDVKKLTSAIKFVEAIRRHGHLEADIYPVGKQASDSKLINQDTDRKSTRLNSSHVAISYAVFCLKKKK